MKKIIAAFFAFTFCFGMNSFAGFKEAAELYEQKKYNEAYNEFLACYKANDLRGNAYLKSLIFKLKKDPDFWTEEELKKLDETTCIRSIDYLKASNLYIRFCKEKNERNKKEIIKELISLGLNFNSRVDFIFEQLAKNINFRKKYNLRDPDYYCCTGLQYVDRDIYISALEKGLLESEKNQKEKLYATILSRCSLGEGELRISKLNKDNVEKENEWLSRAALLGNKEALNLLLERTKDLKNMVGINPLVRNMMGACLIRAAYGSDVDGHYALHAGNMYYSGIHGFENCIIKSLYWYNKAKKAGNFLGAYYCLIEEFKLIENDIENKNDLNINIIDKLVNDVEVFFKNEIYANQLKSKERISYILLSLIDYLLEVKKEIHLPFVNLLDYVIEFGDEAHKVVAGFHKARLILDDTISGNKDKAIQLLKDVAVTLPRAMNMLAGIYREGAFGQEKNSNESFLCYEKTCQMLPEIKDPSYCQYYLNLAECYSRGFGCEADDLKAYKFFKIAYDLAPDYLEPINRLINCCLGLGGTYDDEAYALANEKLNKKLDKFADINEANFKLLGIGCEQNVPYALRIIKKYYKTKFPYAAYLLGMAELIESNESSDEKAYKYFEEAVKWPIPSENHNTFFIEESKKYLKALAEKIAAKKDVNNLSETCSSGDVSVADQENEYVDECVTSVSLEVSLLTSSIINDQEKVIQDIGAEDSSTDADSEELDECQQLIDQARQLSLNKKRILKGSKKVLLNEAINNSNKSVCFKDNLSKKNIKTLKSIMDPTLSKKIKWSAFKKLMCGLMSEKGDYFAPGGGGFKMSVGGKTIGMHMPQHSEAAFLCPGRLEDARQLLETVVPDILSDDEE